MLFLNKQSEIIKLGKKYTQCTAKDFKESYLLNWTTYSTKIKIYREPFKTLRF